MSKILLSPNASGTGTFTIAAPNSSTDRTLTLPDSTGTVIVNSGAQTIEFADGSASSPSITNSGDTNTGMFFPAADTIAFAEGGVEAMRLDSSGSVLVNSTSAIRARIGQMQIKAVSTQEALTTSANDLSWSHWAARSADSGSGTHYLGYFENSSGTNVGSITHNNTNTSYVTSSDYRLKENIVPMTNALDKISQLNPVTYTWKTDGSDGQGFIAHELQSVVPDCVIGEKDAVNADGEPVYQGIDTSFLVATLTKAIQELKAIIDTQDKRIQELEGKA